MLMRIVSPILIGLVAAMLIPLGCDRIGQHGNPDLGPEIVGPELEHGDYAGTFAHLPARDPGLHARGPFRLSLGVDATHGGLTLATSQAIGGSLLDPQFCAFDWVATHDSHTTPGYLCTPAELAEGRCRWRVKFAPVANRSTQPFCDDVDDEGEPVEFQQWESFAYFAEPLLGVDVARAIDRINDLLPQEEAAMADAMDAFKAGEFEDGKWLMGRLVPLGDASVLCERSGDRSWFQFDDEGRPWPAFGLPFDLRDAGHPAGSCAPDRFGVTFWVGRIDDEIRVQ